MRLKFEEIYDFLSQQLPTYVGSQNFDSMALLALLKKWEKQTNSPELTQEQAEEFITFLYNQTGFKNRFNCFASLFIKDEAEYYFLCNLHSYGFYDPSLLSLVNESANKNKFYQLYKQIEFKIGFTSETGREVIKHLLTHLNDSAFTATTGSLAIHLRRTNGNIIRRALLNVMRHPDYQVLVHLIVFLSEENIFSEKTLAILMGHPNLKKLLSHIGACKIANEPMSEEIFTRIAALNEVELVKLATSLQFISQQIPLTKKIVDVCINNISPAYETLVHIGQRENFLSQDQIRSLCQLLLSPHPSLRMGVICALSPVEIGQNEFIDGLAAKDPLAAVTNLRANQHDCVASQAVTPTEVELLRASVYFRTKELIKDDAKFSAFRPQIDKVINHISEKNLLILTNILYKLHKMRSLDPELVLKLIQRADLNHLVRSFFALPQGLQTSKSLHRLLDGQPIETQEEKLETAFHQRAYASVIPYKKVKEHPNPALLIDALNALENAGWTPEEIKQFAEISNGTRHPDCIVANFIEFRVRHPIFCEKHLTTILKNPNLASTSDLLGVMKTVTYIPDYLPDCFNNRDPYHVERMRGILCRNIEEEVDTLLKYYIKRPDLSVLVPCLEFIEDKPKSAELEKLFLLIKNVNLIEHRDMLLEHRFFKFSLLYASLEKINSLSLSTNPAALFNKEQPKDDNQAPRVKKHP